MQRIAQCFEYGIVPLYDESVKLANFGCYICQVAGPSGRAVKGAGLRPLAC